MGGLILVQFSLDWCEDGFCSARKHKKHNTWLRDRPNCVSFYSECAIRHSIKQYFWQPTTTTKNTLFCSITNQLLVHNQHRNGIPHIRIHTTNPFILNEVIHLNYAKHIFLCVENQHQTHQPNSILATRIQIDSSIQLGWWYMECYWLRWKTLSGVATAKTSMAKDRKAIGDKSIFSGLQQRVRL